MTLKLKPCGDIPSETLKVARAAFPDGNALMALRDELGGLFSEEQFADLFPAKGQPAESPRVLALVLVFQIMEGLTDRQAADSVRSRIDWKYALGLELSDAGFDFSILSEFRSRLIKSEAETRLLDTVIDVFKSRGYLKAGGQQRTDSTHVLQSVRDLHRLELVGETLRHVLNEVALQAPNWMKTVVPVEWYKRYGRRFDELHLPEPQKERDELAAQIGRDGSDFLQKLATSEAPQGLKILDSVKILRQIWYQQYQLVDATGQVAIRLKDNADLPSAETRIGSPYDPETRYCKHNAKEWVGYKVHLTETCDEMDRLHLITHVETAMSTCQDVEAPKLIHAALAKKGLLPSEHFMDAGYVSADLLVEALREYGVTIVGPMTQDVSWQAREQTGYDISKFTIEWDAKRVTCPRGEQSIKWQLGNDRGRDVIRVAFAKTTCSVCPAQAACTRSQTQGRSMQIRPREQHEAIQRTRAAQTTEAFTLKYNRRMGIEGTISQAVRAFGARRTRYIGLAKTHLQMVMMAVALNLSRFLDFILGAGPFENRTSPFAALAT